MPQYPLASGATVNASPVSVEKVRDSNAGPAWADAVGGMGGFGSIPVPKPGDDLPIHPEWDTRIKLYNFLDASFRGGARYKYANDACGAPMLHRHDPWETEAGYKRRLAISVLKNHCRPIVRKFNSYVFRQQVARDANPQFLKWCEDVDMQRTTLQAFMRRVMRKAQVLGRYYVGVDTNRPAEAVKLTRAQADAAGIRMFVRAIDPRKLLNWRHINGQLTEALIVYDGGQTAILWTRKSMIVIDLDERGKAKAIDPRPHAFGDIPVIEVSPFEDAASQIEDIAELQRDAFNLEALLREEIHNTTFTQHFVIGANPGEFEDQTSGSNRFLCIRNKDAKIDTTGGDPAQADSIRASITESNTEIYRLAGLKAEDPMTVSPAKSGVALKVEFDDLDAILSAIADEAERCENRVIEFYNLCTGVTVVPSDYPDKFGTPDIQVELDRAFNVLESGSMVRTAKYLESRRINGILHPKAEPEDRQMMDEESLEMFPEGMEAAPPANPLASELDDADKEDETDPGSDAGADTEKPPQ